MKLIVSVMALLAFIGNAVGAEQATFSGATGVLTIPEVSVDGQAFRNATLQYEGGMLFRLTGIDEPSASGQCSEDNINFNRYTSLPGFFTTVTEQGLNELIGCTGTLTAQTNSTSYLRWYLPSSTDSCPRFIEAELTLQNSQNLIMNGGHDLVISGARIVGINSDTNQPYDC